VPADHKWFARVVIGSTIVSALEGLDLRFPEVDESEVSEFKKVREALENERKSAPRPKAAAKRAATGRSGAASDSASSRGTGRPARAN
jgi:hypothetical protein